MSREAISPDGRIHPTAIVEPGIVLGNRTTVWHFTLLRAGAVLGDDCMIGQGCYIAENARIGHRVRIQNGVSVFNGITLEDDVFVGPGVVFTNDLRPRSGNRSALCVETLVRQGASLGAGTTVVCGNTIGRWSMTAAGSVITRAVPDFTLVAGNPARRIGRVCQCGNRLARVSSRRWICRACPQEFEMSPERPHPKLRIWSSITSVHPRNEC